MSDLDAARGRHVKHTDVSGSWCLDCNKVWPCDASLFRDALDALQAEYDEDRMAYLIRFANRRYDAARALADELAERVEALEQLCACFRTDKRPSEVLHRKLDKTRDALAKWEASRAK